VQVRTATDGGSPAFRSGSPALGLALAFQKSGSPALFESPPSEMGGSPAQIASLGLRRERVTRPAERVTRVSERVTRPSETQNTTKRTGHPPLLPPSSPPMGGSPALQPLPTPERSGSPARPLRSRGVGRSGTSRTATL